MHPNLSSSLKEIENEWTLLDCLDAHLMLDAIDDASRSALP